MIELSEIATASGYGGQPKLMIKALALHGVEVAVGRNWRNRDAVDEATAAMMRERAKSILETSSRKNDEYQRYVRDLKIAQRQAEQDAAEKARAQAWEKAKARADAHRQQQAAEAAEQARTWARAQWLAGGGPVPFDEFDPDDPPPARPITDQPPAPRRPDGTRKMFSLRNQ